MEFSDLNDEIVSDDWLIPDAEISRRKLIKQTPHYNIYKADWFGDVLIYEPATNKQQLLSQRRKKHQDIKKEDLCSRLNKLNIELYNDDFTGASSQSRSINSISDTSHLDDSEETDSAYSSISSTPQYHTKDMSNNEFEFPSGLNSPTLSILSYQSTPSVNSFFSGSHYFDSKNADKIEIETTVKHGAQSPVILTKESFTFDVHEGQAGEFCCCSHSLSNTVDMRYKQSFWTELNELRLIAHESFMLFMGASMGETATSLVMQINHPRSTSLFNLLHNTKHVSGSSKSNSSTLDRLLAHSSSAKRQQLNLHAKLNICQQVTNAMTYLHERNIVHAKLTSLNVFIEPNQRVKISLIDNDEHQIATSSVDPSNQSVQFNLPALTYLSPELIRSLGVISVDKCISECDTESKLQVHIDHSLLTTMSDVFSFGTLLFELFEERFPFSEIVENSLKSPNLSYDTLFLSSQFESSHKSKDISNLDTTIHNWNGNIKVSAPELIFQIGSGQIREKNIIKNAQHLPVHDQDIPTKSKRTPLIDYILTRCWSTTPNARLTFKQMATLLCEQF